MILLLFRNSLSIPVGLLFHISVRLRALLDAEEEQYLVEIDAQQETTLERQAKMRARAKALREKREKERLALVEEKLDIRWR